MRIGSLVVGFVVVASVAAFVLSWGHKARDNRTAQGIREVSQENGVIHEHRPVHGEDGPQPAPAVTAAFSWDSIPQPQRGGRRWPVAAPPELEGFEEWTDERQLNAITDIQKNRRLSAATREFLVCVASDRACRPVLRNNAANALGIQEPPVQGWLGKLAGQAVDPEEAPIWRDYAVQHLSDQLMPAKEEGFPNNDFVGSSDSGLDRRGYIDVLKTLADTRLPVAGTALLHLDRLSNEFHLPIDEQGLHRAILKTVLDEGADVGARVTALGLLGARGKPEDADAPRLLLKHADGDIRRASIAALGLVGTEYDLPGIGAAAAGTDPTIESARSVAVGRINRRSRAKSE